MACDFFVVEPAVDCYSCTFPRDWECNALAALTTKEGFLRTCNDSCSVLIGQDGRMGTYEESVTLTRDCYPIPACSSNSSICWHAHSTVQRSDMVFGEKRKTANCPDKSIVRRANCNRNHTTIKLTDVYPNAMLEGITKDPQKSFLDQKRKSAVKTRATTLHTKDSACVLSAGQRNHSRQQINYPSNLNHVSVIKNEMRCTIVKRVVRMTETSQETRSMGILLRKKRNVILPPDY
uniref:Uncharacterized protein n=1 Tax=Glossina pallidipes TaxID=7398 RepID=A0A1B0A3L6_GLOPL